MTGRGRYRDRGGGMSDWALAIDAYLRMHHPEGVRLSTGETAVGVKELIRKLRATRTLRQVADEVSDVIAPLGMGTISDEVVRQWVRAWERADLKEAMEQARRRVSR